MQKIINIVIPEGYEIDLEKSNLSSEKGNVVFKKKTITYDEVYHRLFDDKNPYCIQSGTDSERIYRGLRIKQGFSSKNNVAINKEQLESILALNELANVAKYLNKGWLPKRNELSNWPEFDSGFYIYKDINIKIKRANPYDTMSSVYFKSEGLAKQAIEILGKDKIMKALTLNH